MCSRGQRRSRGLHLWLELLAIDRNWLAEFVPHLIGVFKFEMICFAAGFDSINNRCKAKALKC